MPEIKTVEELKKYLASFKDETQVGLSDPNFSGAYDVENPHFYIHEEGGMLLIDFPFEEAVD